MCAFKLIHYFKINLSSPVKSETAEAGLYLPELYSLI